MQRLMSSVALLCLLLVAGGTPAASQPPAEASTRVGWIEDTVAVTLPASWRIWQPADSVLPVLTATDAATKSRCHLSLGDGPPPSVEELVFGSGSESVEIIERKQLTFPHGDGIYRAWRTKASAEFEASPIQHEYGVPIPGGHVWARCGGEVPATERFAVIVDSITPIVDGSPELTPFEPRIAVPEWRLALSLPAEWNVAGVEAPSTRKGPAFFGDVILFEGILIDGVEPFCRVEEARDAWASRMTADDWRSALAEFAAQDGVASVVIADDDLVAGPAIRIEVESGMLSHGGITAWLVPDGERIVSLVCSGDQLSADGWRSIADTLEILPESP